MTTEPVGTPANTTDSTAYRRRATVVVLASGPDRSVALDLADRTAVPLALDGPAALVFSALDDHPTVAGLVPFLVEATGHPPTGIRHDVEIFLGQLQDANLIEPAPVDSPREMP